MNYFENIEPKRLKQMIKERNISEFRLAGVSDLPQSTISNISLVKNLIDKIINSFKNINYHK